MKKILILLFLTSLFSFNPVKAEQEEYRLIKIVDGDTFYIDFNANGQPDADEKVRVNGIDTFEVKMSDKLNEQMVSYKLTPNEALGLGFYAKEYANKNLLGKYVSVKYTAENKYDSHKRHLVSISYPAKNGQYKDYAKEVLKEGLSVVYRKSNLADDLKQYENSDKMKKHIKNSHELNLVLLNKNTNKYHQVNCKNIKNSNNLELVNDIPQNAEKAKCCN